MNGSKLIIFQDIFTRIIFMFSFVLIVEWIISENTVIEEIVTM